MMTQPLVLEVNGVSKRFSRKSDVIERIGLKIGLLSPLKTVHAVDDVSLTAAKGEVIGLVGESGCGKSTLGRLIAGITPVTGGSIRVLGQDLAALKGARAVEAKLKTQMVFQDPMSSLNPRMRVAQIVGEAPLVHGLVKRRELADYVDEQLYRVGLDPSTKRRYPHQFSGGQRQRINIARALAVQPSFLVCDESVAALDVSIQAQVLNLFMNLRETLDLTYLFISHDLAVVNHISDRVAIMYLGRIVEQAATEEIFSRPNHPYTRALLAAMPRIETGKATYHTIKGEIPSPLSPPDGCHFHPRCSFAFDRCRTQKPQLKTVASGHVSACHLND